MLLKYLIVLAVWIYITQAEEGVILIAEADYGHSIKSFSTMGGNVTTIHAKGTWGEPRGFTYNNSTNMVYVFDSGKNTITGFNLEAPETLVHVVYVLSGWLYDITMDTIQGHLFVPDSYRDIIYRVNTDGTGLTQWIEADDPTGVAVHEQTGYIYWSEYNNDQIVRAPLSNSSHKEIIVTGVNGPRGIHFESNTMYWCALWDNEVGQASINGDDKRIIATIPSPNYITGMAGHLYVSSGFGPGGKSKIFDIYNGAWTVLDLNGPINAYGILVIPLNNHTTVSDLEQIPLQTSTSTVEITSQDNDVNMKQTTDAVDLIKLNPQDDENLKQTTNSTDPENSIPYKDPNIGQTTRQTLTEQMSAIVDENTILSPTVMIGIIAGAVVVVVIIAVTGIVITILVLKNRTKRDNKPKDVKDANSETLTCSVIKEDLGPKQKEASPEFRNDNSVYMDIDDITTNSIIAPNDKHSVVYEEPISRAYESTDQIQRHQYGNMQPYTTLDKPDE